MATENCVEFEVKALRDLTWVDLFGPLAEGENDEVVVAAGTIGKGTLFLLDDGPVWYADFPGVPTLAYPIDSIDSIGPTAA